MSQKQANFEKSELSLAMKELSSLNPVDGKAAMMNQVDGAAGRVINVLAKGDPIALQKGEYLTQIRFVLGIMEQCKDFRDAQFTRMVRQRAEEIMGGLEKLPARAKELAEEKKRKDAAAKAKAEADAKAKADADAAAKAEQDAKKAKPKEPEFPYELAEKICIQNVVRFYDRKLDCLRSVQKYGRHSTVDIGIAPHFLYSLEFSVLIEDAISALVKESRDILTRRIYNETDPKADEEVIRKIISEKSRPLIDVMKSGFAGWGAQQKEAEKALKRGAPGAKQEKTSASSKKDKKGGLFSKLLKKDAPAKEAPAPKAKKQDKPNWQKVREKWAESEKKGEIFFPRTFNFDVFAYLADLRENIFISEVDRVVQIKEQAEGATAKGAVTRGLEQVFKNNDQTFFELVILNLLYTKSKIGLEEVQNACMGQKLDEGRLPLSIPEMGRRPNAYAELIIVLLKDIAEPRRLKVALDHFFEALLILHLMKYEKDFKNAATYLEINKEKLDKPIQGVLDGVLGLIDRVLFARQQARETGEDTSRNTRDTIEHTIGKFMTAYTGMYEKMKK